MRRVIFFLLLAVLLTAIAPQAWAHTVQGRDADFLKSVSGPYPGPFIYLGAKHMVTGYDHLLFLVGVIFFLYRMKDVAIYVTCFAVGHSVTLLTGVLSGIHVNPYLVDALIGVSVIYKAFDNLDGFRTLFGWQPNTKLAVLGFGLIHGFGLATKLQDFKLSANGLVTNMVSFNVGVELGQLVALSIILMVMIPWRGTAGFLRQATFANVLLMTAGFALMGYQLAGYVMQSSRMTPHVLSRGGLLLRLGIAAAAGAFIVFCVVLPAEYRYDPTGFGRVTGLLELTKPRVATPDVAAKAGDADATEPVDPALAQFPEASGGMPTNRTANKSYDGEFHSDTVKIPMKPDGELEYKLKMKTGETVVYSWKVDRGLVYYDLHGQPEDPKKSQRYKEVQEATSANGALVAPFDGIHGWYFLNLTGEPLVVTLNVAGYYELYGYVK